LIVKRLELENIRSYRQGSITFPEGKTLFEGDIGSGKSTILMAIEFAFFGFGTESGTSLLRAGSAEGSVKMVFSTDEGEYTVERGLVRKGRGVQQTNGVLRTPEGDMNLSPSELKEKVLEVLGFNEAPDPRAQSWIYRYAVYTPQEEMKAVLGLPPDLRLQVLRRAFGIEDYKTAAENSANLVREIGRKASEFEGMSRGIQELKSKLAEVQEQRSTYSMQAADGKEKQEILEEELRRLRKEKDELHERELHLRESEETIKLLREKEADMQLVMKEEKETTRELSRRIEALNKKLSEVSQLGKPSKLSSEALEASADEARKNVEKLSALEVKLSSKIEEYRTILAKGRCPVCDRKVGAHEFKDKERAKRSERRHLAGELAQERKKEKNLRNLARRMSRYESAQKEAEETSLDLKRCTAELERSREKISRAESETRAASFRIEILEKKLTSLAPFLRRAEEVTRGIEDAERRLAEHRDNVSRILEGIELSAKREDEIKREIAEKEDAARMKGSLQEYGLWISDYFLPALRQIEKNVMLSLNREFDSLFRKWFASLVDDPGKEARVDELFTPVVTQDGYDQEVYYLSGGEKTSVSLAYRLALNSLVQRVSTTRSNVLILDEPTDGFSKEQLGNVREVLDEVDCQQVIVVSHEKELESFADQVFRVVKENGQSAVLTGSS
jgi:exonuclease SbcC